MKKLLIFMSAALLLTACGSDEPNNKANEPGGEEPTNRPLEFPVPIGEAPAEPIFDPTSVADFTKGMKNFSANYFEAVCNTENDNNIVVSPLSAYYALAMLANGADGDTRSEIVKAFGFDNVNMSDLNSFASGLKSELADSDIKVAVESANSLWMNPKFPVYKSFRTVLSENYGAEPYMIIPETFQEDLNAWCNEKTHGLIKEFEINTVPLTALFNAIYFKAPWQGGFDESLTSEDTFHNFDGSTTKSDFMHSTAIRAAKTVNNDATIINIAMGYFNNYYFNIVIPDNIAEIGACTPLVASDTEYSQTNIYKMSMPKFNIENFKDITNEMIYLGIKKTFSPESNFFRISDTDLNFKQIFQANNFIIDEKGIEAASVTGTGEYISNGEYEKPDYEEIVIDRPFVFSITERTTGAVLFMGKVTKL